MRTSYIISFVIAAIAAIWVLSAVIMSPAKNAETESVAKAEKELFEVRVKTSTAQSVTDYAVVTGRTQANRRVEIAAEIDARVVEILVEEGTKVENTAALAKLALDDRAARVQETKKTLNQRRIEYNAAKSLEKKGFNSQIRLAEALALLESAKAELTLAEKNLANTDIKAPFDGIVNVQEVEVGDYVRIGDPLFTIVELDPIEVVGFVSERNIIGIEKGSSAEVEFLNGQTLNGTVTFIAPAADTETRTFRVKVELPNSDFEIRDGLTAELRIPLTQKNAHEISSSVLTLNDDGVLGVKVIEDNNKAVFKPVQIISSADRSIRVSGLPEQIELITVGAEFVADGQEVKAVQE